mgnify:FL=1
MKIKSKKLKKKLKKFNINPDDFIRRRSPIQKDAPDIDKMLDTIIKRDGPFFCSQPFIHMYIPTYGLAHPCCNTTVNVKKHISEIGINGVWNQPELANLREEMANGNKERKVTAATCYRCIETEYRGFDTPRIAYNNDMLEDKDELAELDRLVKFVRENPASEYPIPKKIHTSQIKVWGNYCNLKCLMCSAEDSSSVAEEWIALGEYTPDLILLRSELRSASEMPFKFPLINYQDNNIDEEEFWEVIKKTKRIQLIGGETWLIKQYVQILERCVKEGWAKDKKIFAFSNNFGYPKMQYIYDLLKEFKSVHYKCSMELWGQKNDYIRYPSRWSEVYKNIKLMSTLPNVNLGFAFTLNPLNIGYVDEAVKGASEFNKKPSFFNLTRPAWFTLKSLPPDLKNFYIDKLYNNSYDIIDKIQKPLEYLENLEFDELQHHTMIARIKARDNLRGDNILKYFPEWTQYFK